MVVRGSGPGGGMKHFHLDSLVLLIMIVAAGCTPAATPPPPTATLPPPTDPPATTTPMEAKDNSPWKIVHQIEVEQPMRMAAFLDANFGLTGGFSDPGKAHYTTDGGQTWTKADTSGG